MTQKSEKFETRKLPMMPIRDVVIFPHMMTPFVVGRESSVRALEEALAAANVGDYARALETYRKAEVLRPDLLIFDDCQTDEAASNPATARARLSR